MSQIVLLQHLKSNGLMTANQSKLYIIALLTFHQPDHCKFISQVSLYTLFFYSISLFQGLFSVIYFRKKARFRSFHLFRFCEWHTTKIKLMYIVCSFNVRRVNQCLRLNIMKANEVAQNKRSSNPKQLL